MGDTLGEVIKVPCHAVPLLLDDELLLLLDDELLLLLDDELLLLLLLLPPPPLHAAKRAAIQIMDSTPIIFFMIFRFSFQPKITTF